MNNNVITKQAHFCTALYHTFSNHTATHLADTSNIKYIADFGIAEEFFSQFRRQQTFKAFFHIIGNIINDGIVADINSIAASHVPSLGNGTDVKADNKCI